MELSDVVLALVGIISAITGGVVKSLVADLKGVEKQISSMPKEYVFKADYTDDAHEIKTELREQSKKIDQIWKHMRIDK
jgi:hypothetical protein